MAIHFEELWERCEQFHNENSTDTSLTVLEELLLKINLYKALSVQKEMPSDLQEAKSRLLGEIILTITNLSLRENINVYDSLTIALRTRSATQFSQKHQV